MSTFTSRLNLELPIDTESMALGDDILSANYTKIDAAFGSTITGTQPPAPFDGQVWSNTDAFLTTKFFQGSWLLFGNQSIAKGFKAFDLDGTTRQSTNNVITLISNMSFAAKAGRSYHIDVTTFYKWQQANVRGALSYYLRRTNDNVDVAQRRFDWFAGANNDYGQAIDFFAIYDETVDRTVNMSLRLDTTEGGGLTAELGALGVETTVTIRDWGES